MKHLYLIFFLAIFFSSCRSDSGTTSKKSDIDLNGTWKLIIGSVITKGVPSVTDYTKDQEMIKIINADHFAFMKHPTTAKPDSTNKFDAGGGRYELKGNQYTEHLDFYGDKKFEGTTYHFTIQMKGDTLIQQGKEGADRSIIEKYIKLR